MINKHIINSNEELRAYVPNQIITVKGETSLYDKVFRFIVLAENWVIETFTSESTFNTICGYTDSNPLKTVTARLVVAEAMLRAIPSLDVVFTPNGLATVGTQNLVAASRARVDRLCESMLSHRDDCVAAILPALPGASKWINSAQADFFGATLFPDLSLVEQTTGSGTDKWQRYLELRSKVIDLEASLAEEWFSPELMAELRAKNLRNSLSEPQGYIARQIKAQILGYIADGSFSSRRLADIVNFIRNDETSFPQWHSSATAQLFSPPLFRNRKQAAGYFF